MAKATKAVCIYVFPSIMPSQGNSTIFIAINRETTGTDMGNHFYVELLLDINIIAIMIYRSR